MRIAFIIAIGWGILVGPARGQANNKPTPPGRDPTVVANSEKSLVDAVGDGFIDTWESPYGLLPHDFPGLKYVSGPEDEASPKARWRKPVVMKEAATGAELSVNCYRRRDELTHIGLPALTPIVPLTEPDYQYKAVAFHDLHAAAASEADSAVFAFRDGDLLYKVAAKGANAKSRQDAVAAAAEAIWKFRHTK